MQLSMFAVALFPQTISAADPAAGDACAPYTVLADVGLMDEPTTLHHYTNTTAAAQCCSLCAADSRCVAWTYHAAPVHDCYTTAHVNRHAVHGATSGYLPGALPTPTPTPPPPPTAPPAPRPPTPKPVPPLGYQPNIVLILTDDQDVHLGGMTPMPKTRRLLGEAGATAAHMYIHTPVCCPSRAETLTGRFFHNIKLDAITIHADRNGGGCMANGCMCVDVDKVNPVSFALDLYGAGYEVGMFGKYLNSCPKVMPPGFSRWFANGGGTFTDCAYYDDRAPGGVNQTNSSLCAGYQTSQLGNVSMAWIEERARSPGPRVPFFAFVAPHAPHVPATPAPWYARAFADPALAAHYRTPNFNASAPDHHWVVAQQGPLDDAEAAEIDALFRNRWRTLLSVDDLVEGIVGRLEALGVLNETFVFYTSDHGYNLGQFRLAGNKLHAYDNTLRIPLLMRGPRVAPNSTWAHPTSNADLAPTFLALAGTSNPAMDGTSFAPQLLGLPGAPARRTYHYSEYNSLGNWSMFGHLIDCANSHTFRALRFVGDAQYGNRLYAEYTSLADWNFRNASEYKFFELIDSDADPWQLVNTFGNASDEQKADLHEMVERHFSCAGPTCQ